MSRIAAMLLATAVFASASMADSTFPTNCTTTNINIASLKSDFKDFKFTWVGWNDQNVLFTWTNGSSSLVVTSFYASFKASKGTNYYILLENDSISKSTNLTWFSIAHTNLPPNGFYQAEMILYTATDPAIVRTVARGQIQIQQSLFGDDDGAFPFPETAVARTTFLGLTDTPSNYTGQAGKTIKVNASETAMEYTTANLDDIAILNSNTVDRTGTRGMQADLPMGGHGITGISTNSLEFSDGVSITSTKIQLYDTFSTGKVDGVDYIAFTNAQHVLNTGYDGRIDVLETTGATTADVAAVQTDLDNHKTNTGVHAIAAVTGLQTALDGKAGTASVAQVASDLSTHEGLTGTAVHGLGTMSTQGTGDYYTAAAADLLLAAKAGTATVAAIDGRVGTLESGTSTWYQAATDAASATASVASAQADIAILQTQKLDVVTAASTYATTGTVGAIDTRVSVMETGKVDYVNAAYTSTVALAASALQPGDTGTTTNLSDYNNDVGYLTNEPLWQASSAAVMQVVGAFPAVSNAAITGSNLAHEVSLYTNRVVALEPWTNDVIELQGLTSGYNQAVTDSASWTNNKLAWNDASDLTNLPAGMTNYLHVASPTNWLAYDGVSKTLSGCVTNDGAGVYQPVSTNLDAWAGIGVDTKVDTDNVDYTNALAIALAAMTNFTHVASSTNWLSYDPATHTLSGCVTNTGSGAGTITNMLSTDGSISWTENGGPQPDGSVTSAVANWSAYSAQNTILQNVSSYPTNTTWVQKGHYVPGGPYHATSAIFSNEIYIIGGYRSLGSDATTNVFRYNGMRFEEVKGLPGAMAYGRSAVLGDYLYVLDIAGGTNCYKFDGTDWTWFPAPPSGLLGDCGLVNYDSALYFVGGQTKATNVYSFDGTTYTARAGLPAGCHGHGIAVYSNKIWVVGGYQTMTNAFSFDGSSWAWAPGISAGMGMADLGVHTNTYIPYRIYSIGGMKSSWSWSSNSYVFNGDTWSPFPSPVSSTMEGACVEMYDDQLFCIGGGFNVSTVSSNIYVMYSKAQFSNSIAADSWFCGDVSAQTFTDRTPYPESTEAAIAAIKSMKLKHKKIITTNEIFDTVVWDAESKTNIYSDKRLVVTTNEVNEGVDHESLNPILKSKGGRDLSMTVSVLSEVIQDLLKRLSILEKDKKVETP